MFVQVLPALGRYEYNPAVAMWLAALAFITYMCAIVSISRNFVLMSTFLLLATGSVLGSIGFFAASKTFILIAAYFCKCQGEGGGPPGEKGGG
jgi:hypothetical protein